MEVMGLMDALFEMRLIEKIARPLDRKNKEELLMFYG
jgi:hypothetical protein